MADSAAASGHRLPISPFLTIIVVTWAGTMMNVHSQSVRRAKKPSAAEATSAAGRPMVQNSALSQASRRPLKAWMPSSSRMPVTTARAMMAFVGSMPVLSAAHA